MTRLPRHQASLTLFAVAIYNFATKELAITTVLPKIESCCRSAVFAALLCEETAIQTVELHKYVLLWVKLSMSHTCCSSPSTCCSMLLIAAADCSVSVR